MGAVDDSDAAKDLDACWTRTMSNSRTALVTGAAGGMGRAIALALKARGLTVFGTSRRPDEKGPADYPMIALDVRSDESVSAAMALVRERAGRLDVLVNNAGSRFLGAVEETTVEDAKSVFETNFFGTHRVTRAALPLLRQAGGGKIITVTSLAGVNAVPFGAIYSASKWALEGYFESLRQEVKPFGIDVAIVEPGAVRSERREAPQQPRTAIAAYAAARAHAFEVILRGDEKGMDVGRVADCVARIVESRSPRLRHRVGLDATWFPRFKMLSWSFYEIGVRRRYALDADK